MELFGFSLTRKRDALPKQDTAGTPMAPGEALLAPSTERGTRNGYDDMAGIYDAFTRRLWVDGQLLQTIRDIRAMDRDDMRVKKIHGRSARAAARGGLRLMASGQPRLERLWGDFERRTQLHNPQKLQSDLRGLMTDGHLALQWVLDANERVAAAPRMPPETLRANVNKAGVFDNSAKAYDQIDIGSGKAVATFGLWQLTMGRLDPLNFDDWGSPGRPYLDSARGTWKKLVMTEEDMVLRRHMRAPMRMAHTLEGASGDELADYKQQVENDQGHGSVRDYYLNKKGSVAAVQGDANLEQIADVSYLLDTFFTGAPAPKGLFGYSGDLSRDILEDLKRDYFDELGAIQSIAASVYEQGFRLDLLLQGVNPMAYDFQIGFAERLTDTANQRADLALKFQALGASRETTFETAGLNAAQEADALAKQAREVDPYAPLDVGPDGQPIATPTAAKPTPSITVTPGNARKGESATNVSTSTRN